MIAPNIAQNILEQVAAKIGVTALDDSRVSVDLPWTYPDGDCCRLYVSKAEDGRWRVSDGGDAIARLSYKSSENLYAKVHANRFAGILQPLGLEHHAGEVIARAADLGAAVYAVAQASIDLVHIGDPPREKKDTRRSHQFGRRLERIIHAAVSSDRVTPKWHDEVTDADGLYKVDYRIEPPNPTCVPVFVFGANTNTRCVRATLSCLFYREKRTPFRAIACFDEETENPNADARRLNQLVEKRFSNLVDAELIKAHLRDQMTFTV